jgi:hypothetical protein
MKVLKINNRWKDSGPDDCLILYNVNVLELGFQLCRSLRDLFPSDVSFNIKSPLKPRDIFSYGTMQIVSHRIVNIISSFENSFVEFFSVNVTWNGEEYVDESFFLMNVLDRLHCFDTERSQYTVDRFIDDDENTSYISEIYKLAVHPVDENLHEIFYIDDPFDSPSILCVSDSIAQEMISQDIIGCELIDIDSYKEGLIIW